MSGGVLLSGSIASRRRERGVAAAVAGGVLLFLAFHVFDCGDLRPPHASAQDVAAQVEHDDATVLILAQAMVADGGWNARNDRWDHEMIAHALLAQSEQRGVPLRDQAVDYVAAFDARRRVSRSVWVRCLNLEATKPCGWPSRLSWSAHVDLWLGIIEKARAFLADPSSVPNPCPNGYHFGTLHGLDGERAKRAGWDRAVCWAQTRNGVWSIARRWSRR